MNRPTKGLLRAAALTPAAFLLAANGAAAHAGSGPVTSTVNGPLASIVNEPLRSLAGRTIPVRTADLAHPHMALPGTVTSPDGLLKLTKGTASVSRAKNGAEEALAKIGKGTLRTGSTGPLQGMAFSGLSAKCVATATGGIDESTTLDQAKLLGTSTTLPVHPPANYRVPTSDPGVNLVLNKQVTDPMGGKTVSAVSLDGTTSGTRELSVAHCSPLGHTPSLGGHSGPLGVNTTPLEDHAAPLGSHAAPPGSRAAAPNGKPDPTGSHPKPARHHHTPTTGHHPPAGHHTPTTSHNASAPGAHHASTSGHNASAGGHHAQTTGHNASAGEHRAQTTGHHHAPTTGHKRPLTHHARGVRRTQQRAADNGPTNVVAGQVMALSKTVTRVVRNLPEVNPLSSTGVPITVPQRLDRRNGTAGLDAAMLPPNLGIPFAATLPARLDGPSPTTLPSGLGLPSIDALPSTDALSSDLGTALPAKGIIPQRGADDDLSGLLGGLPGLSGLPTGTQGGLPALPSQISPTG
jgi:aarF domain-containing kinase